MLRAETASDAPGAEEVVARLADALLTQALRLALVDIQSRNGAPLLALRDPQIAEAIALIHGQPERAWAVGELAAKVALSRSEFAARFRDLVGESPLRYVTRTRLAHAALLLRTSDAPLAQIAARAGYRTAFSFGKAFKRTFGIAPGEYRGQANGRPKLEVAAPGAIDRKRPDPIVYFSHRWIETTVVPLPTSSNWTSTSTTASGAVIR
jgi:transcriptional regulator GlxA family with amidase domain